MTEKGRGMKKRVTGMIEREIKKQAKERIKN